MAATNAPCPTGDCRSHRVSQRPSIATESFSVNYGKCLPKLQNPRTEEEEEEEEEEHGHEYISNVGTVIRSAWSEWNQVRRARWSWWNQVQSESLESNQSESWTVSSASAAATRRSWSSRELSKKGNGHATRLCSIMTFTGIPFCIQRGGECNHVNWLFSHALALMFAFLYFSYCLPVSFLNSLR